MTISSSYEAMTNFNGVFQHRIPTERYFSEGLYSREWPCTYEARAKSMPSRVASSQDIYSKFVDGAIRMPLKFGESFGVKANSSRNTRSSFASQGFNWEESKPFSHIARASGSEDDTYATKSDELPSMEVIPKKSSKKAKRKKSHCDVKQRNELINSYEEDSLILNGEVLPSHSDAKIRVPQEVAVFSRIWTDDEKHSLETALSKLEALHLHALAVEQWHSSSLVEVHRKYQESARNLLHYMAIKSVDIKDIHFSLSALGLASIEGIESHVLTSLNRSIRAARALSMFLAHDMNVRDDDDSGRSTLSNHERQLNNRNISDSHNRATNIDSSLTSFAGRYVSLLSCNTVELFGPRLSERKAYIMVTLSEEMIGNNTLVLDLMKAGMDIVRINCAHGNPEEWKQMIETVRHCSQMLEQPCRVLMDLAGPKLRTSPFPPGPCVQKIKPQRDGLGNAILPARVWIALPGTPVPEGTSADVFVPVKGDIWLGSVQTGDKLMLRDGRGKLREIIITDKVMGSNGMGCWAECFQTIYLESGTKLKLLKKKGKLSKGYVADLPPMEQFIRLKKGDVISLTKESSFLDANDSDLDRPWVYQIQVSHTFGQLFDCVKPGELISFDDGRIEGVIRGATSSEICVEVTYASEKGTKLGGGKSINLPNSSLCQKGLTVKDILDLDFIIRHADIVALSFVNSSKDVQVLQKALKEKGATNIGVVLKIETRSGVMNLLEVLLQGMKNENPLGVMIARGDLAVECGWEDMASVQEEVLRVCKAAHIPTIWATQVLESLTKQGLSTRPEITDAALGGRASCVMLNKGSHILKAVSILSRILNTSPNPWWESSFRLFAD
ncbi:hypothetical protein KP509_19G042100 [Ceratopteris richardii]|uniref:pyruvate kinase n=1 Tax=Ceratopteris richardii TaxID=49495 RepID=A0A8T2SMZ4_CERRI|nr:hypothetical protein KP509_19G042100 [Ceratopteris richardii]